jgi:hypothetical protein
MELVGECVIWNRCRVMILRCARCGTFAWASQYAAASLGEFPCSGAACYYASRQLAALKASCGAPATIERSFPAEWFPELSDIPYPQCWD